MKVLILGLGQYPQGSGVAAALYFAKQGHDVIATDLKKANQLGSNVQALKRFKNVRFTLGRHDVKDVRWADLIVRNPRVRRDSPEMREAARRGVPLESDLSIFLKSCPCPVIGVTGTRGKSTTTMMLYEILRAAKKWRKVWLGGNILVSPLTFIDRVKPTDIVVLEMSSWQLEATGEAGVSPHVAVWTNLMRDHLNSYSSMEEYAEAKAQIFRHQRENDVVILPAERRFDAYAKEAPGKVVRVGGVAYATGASGEHNASNASMAAAAAREVGVSPSTIRKVLKAFTGLPYRQQIVGVKRGITFVNDTTATTPDGTLAALRVFHAPKKENRVHLIFGGADKELEFEEVAAELGKRHDVAAYVLPGDAEKKYLPLFKKHHVAFERVQNLKDAFRKIKQTATKGDFVLLSPGATSFAQFKNEFDRGDQFNALVKVYGR